MNPTAVGAHRCCAHSQWVKEVQMRMQIVAQAFHHNHHHHLHHIIMIVMIIIQKVQMRIKTTTNH